MNVNEVKKAQQIIRSAKIDLALIVKKYFESGNPLMVNDLKPFDISITDLFADQKNPVQIFFEDRKTNLQIQVDLICKHHLIVFILYLAESLVYIITIQVQIMIFRHREKQISVITLSEMGILIHNLIWLKLNFVITLVNK